MASTSTSSVQRSFVYDVFLSFHGKDVRKSFVDHLCKALNENDIIIYKDDKCIVKGEDISDQLISAIRDSRFHIIVFSKNYASSTWCLEELAEIMDCTKTKEQIAYPIFYDVEPTEVRYQSGPVGDVFSKHVDKKSAGRWRYALNQASNLAGWELKNTVDGHEVQFIKKVVEDILQNPHFTTFSIDSNLVGMATRMESLLSSLHVDSDDVRMIGIKGMGGGGKTTLARAMFDHISSRFEGKSFVENVRERSKGSGLQELQQQVLTSVFNDRNIVVPGIFDGIYMMKKRMPSKKVLVVLDNVEQLEALAGGPTWYKPGSRIIITTRDHQVLARRVQSDDIHDVSMLSDDEATCLLSKHAFNAEIPDQGYEYLSKRVVRYAAGLPLTIKTLGSFLCGRPKDKWEDTIDRLKTIPSHDTLKRLEISYDGLEEDQKQIFLHLACLLKGEIEGNAIRILETCGFHAQIGLSVLEQKSLITLRVHHLYEYLKVVALHDRLTEMGENIVRRWHPDEPRRHIILWKKDEIEDILVKELGTEDIKSIKLLGTGLHETTILQGLKKMTNLRFLYITLKSPDYKIDEASGYLPDTLRFLRWPSFRFRYLPTTFQADKLVHLEMPRNNIHRLWEGEERNVLPKLRFLDLSSGSKLESFDLGTTPNLEKLILQYCGKLVELNATAECLRLKEIDLLECKAFERLNVSNKCLHLEKLKLRGCSDFKELLMHSEFPKLKSLDFSFSGLANLNLGPTSNLEHLYLSACKHFVQLHMPVKFSKLITLHLGGFKASDFKPGLAPFLETLERLETLCLQIEDIECLPDSICTLQHLKSLDLSDCVHLKQLPEDICNMKCLKGLDISGCWRIRKLPDDFGRLESLTRLTVSKGRVKNLSQSTSQLKALKSVSLTY